MLKVIFARPKLEKTVVRLGRKPDSTAFCLAGFHNMPCYGVCQLLHHKTVSFDNPALMRDPYGGLKPLYVHLSRSRVPSGSEKWFVREVRNAKRVVGVLFVMLGDVLYAYYAASKDMHIEGAACLSVRGAGMESLEMLPISEREQVGRERRDNSNNREVGGEGEENESSHNRVRYERFAGTLGKGNLEEGYSLLNKAATMKVVVIGAGRAGSILAFRLAQCGVGRKGGFIVVDPDKVEESNLSDMFVPDVAVGKPKAEAVCRTIVAFISDANPCAYNCGLDNQEVIDEICSADIVFTAVDEDSVRLGIAVLAVRQHLVHIDVCGGSSRVGGKHVEEGGELRLFIPGSNSCLACMGQYNWRQAGKLLSLSTPEERQRRAILDWTKDKVGSSADILYPVIGEAMQAFWSILRGDLKTSVWWHYGKGKNGLPMWSDWTQRKLVNRCRVCGKQAGLGDISE